MFVAQDGFTWHMSPTPPYGTQIKLSSGETITVSTRERPKMFFDESGQMTHLFSTRGSSVCVCCQSLSSPCCCADGVCSTPACPPPNGPKTGCVDCKYKGWDYTLVAPLDV